MNLQPIQACERCGVRALVHIRPDAGEPDNIHHFCLACADEAVILPFDQVIAEPRLSRYGLLIGFGLIVLILSAGADFFAFGQADGFGWKQSAGVACGAALVLVGAVTRAQTILVSGLILGGVTFLADWIGFGSAGGFGWQQILGCLLGLIFILIGFFSA